MWTSPPSAETSRLRIVALGDSLTAGFELPPEAAFPVQLEKALTAKGHSVTIENAGVSGDTTGAALERLEWAIPEGTAAVIVELGANDFLRGLPPGVARANLDAILTRLKARNIPVLLCGMLASTNMGAEYKAQFDAIYPDLAAKHGAILYPFFLDGVAMDIALNLDDGMHPNAKGIAAIVTRIVPAVEQLIVRARP